MKRIVLACAGLLCWMAPGVLQANICDDIHALANRWHKVANYIHERHGEELPASERREVTKQERQLISPTKDLAKLCKGDDNKRVQSLGKQISSVLEEYEALGEHESWDEDVKVLDKLVEILDNLTHLCDNN